MKFALIILPIVAFGCHFAAAITRRPNHPPSYDRKARAVDGDAKQPQMTNGNKSTH
jgi:hypothetical protein